MIRLNENEKRILYKMIESLTGTSQSGSFRKEILLSNVENRIRKLKIRSFEEYLLRVKNMPEEFARFLSSITIHTTSWFRERPHFDHIVTLLKGQKFQNDNQPLTIWCAACSTGQEVYSMALLLENLREEHLLARDFVIRGTDIDPESIKFAEKAIYRTDEIAQIDPPYRKFLREGTGKFEGNFTIVSTLKNKCYFDVASLLDLKVVPESYHLILCRNVLIYFDLQTQKEILNLLVGSLKVKGYLTLGHSEALQSNFDSLSRYESSIYQKVNENNNPKKTISRGASTRIRVLVVEDDPVMRTPISELLRKNDFEVVEAGSVGEAAKLKSNGSIDIISLDVGLPEINGVSWLKQLRDDNDETPVIILSGSGPRELESIYGTAMSKASEFFSKELIFKDFRKYMDTLRVLALRAKTKKILSKTKGRNSGVSDSEVTSEAINSKIKKRFENKRKFKPAMILIGASTGGPQAIWTLLRDFPKNCPPILVVQHTNPFFAPVFAKRVGAVSGLKVEGHQVNSLLTPGTVYLAHGDYHIGVRILNKQLFLSHSNEPPGHGHRPNVNHLFKSVAQTKVDTISILLTGMGVDGADGMLSLYNGMRSYNIAEGPESSVVFGMPKEAIEKGAVDFVGTLPQIREKLLSFLEVPTQDKRAG